MTKKEAIKILTNFNKGRLGAEMPQPNPKEITAALNYAIKYLNKDLKSALKIAIDKKKNK